MPRLGFETLIPTFERVKTIHALDRAVTVIGIVRRGPSILVFCGVILSRIPSRVVSWNAWPYILHDKIIYNYGFENLRSYFSAFFFCYQYKTVACRSRQVWSVGSKSWYSSDLYFSFVQKLEYISSGEFRDMTFVPSKAFGKASCWHRNAMSHVDKTSTRTDKKLKQSRYLCSV
jgi:hypothetical protein